MFKRQEKLMYRWIVFSFIAVTGLLGETVWAAGIKEEVDLSIQPPEVIIHGAEAGDTTGYSVAYGDIDGDGNNDILIGAPDAGGPSDTGRNGAGRIYVRYGKTPLPGTIDLSAGTDLIIYGASDLDHLGFALTSADVNRDGYDDILASAPSGYNEKRGYIVIVYGNGELSGEIDLATPAGDTTFIYGKDKEDRIGCSITTGDIDGDGIRDIIVGSRYGDGPKDKRTDAGEVYLFYGKENLKLSDNWDLSDTPADFTLYGKDAEDDCGCSVSTGDLDGDGYDDIVVGAIKADGPDNSRTDAGEVYVIYGRGKPDLEPAWDLLSKDADLTIYGRDAGDLLGTTSATGDFNGDGIEDLLIAAPMGDGPDELRGDAGEVYLIHGRNDLPSTLDLSIDLVNLTVFGADSGDKLGSNTVTVNKYLIINGFSSSMGDYNGDNLDDIIVTAPHAGGPDNGRSEGGEIYLIYGSNSFLPMQAWDLKYDRANLTFYGTEAGDRLGVSIVLGDLNGDGYADILAGVPMADGPGNGRQGAGEVYLLLSRRPVTNQQSVTTDEDTAKPITLTGSDPNGDNLTFSVDIGPNNGSLTGAPPAVVYTPNSNFNGSDGFTFKVNDGILNSVPAIVLITVNAINDAPVANAGFDQTADEGILVTLNESGSSDADGDTLDFMWEQTAGPLVTMSNPKAIQPTFTSPTVFTKTKLIFRLIVSDEKLQSSDTVEVTVNNTVNESPVAHAGVDQTVGEGVLVTLDGSGSSDPNGDQLIYKWKQAGGPFVAMGDPASKRPTFTSPTVVAETELTFELTVMDSGQLKSMDTVVVTVKNTVNEAPVARAGSDQTVNENVTVTLDGSGSSDPNGGDQLTYSWKQTPGASVTLSNPTAATATFTSPTVAETEVLTFILTVSDGLHEDTDEVNIKVEKTPVEKIVNVPPVADAGPEQTVNEGVLVTLDGSGSSDPNGHQLIYKWKQAGGPFVAIGDPASKRPTFTSPTVLTTTILTFELIVSDGEFQSPPDTVEVTVNNTVNEAPVARAGAVQSVGEGSEVTLDGSGSYDINGDEITYTWDRLTGPKVILADTTNPKLVFTAPLVFSDKDITFELTVSDGHLTHTDTVTIHVTNTYVDNDTQAEFTASNMDSVLDMDDGISELSGTRIDGYDLMVLLRAFGSKTGEESWRESADIDANGEVDENDLSILLYHFGESR